MNEYLLSWSFGVGGERQGGRKNSPEWADVELSLRSAWQKSGTVTIDVVEGSDIGPQSLQVQTEHGLSIITLGVDTGEDYIVRDYVAGKVGTENVEILGNSWKKTSICSDFNVVIRSFKEFFDTGDVSIEILN